MYYVTMKHDNVEEVISVHPYDTLEKVIDHLTNEHGELQLWTNKATSIKATPVNNEDIQFTIVKHKISNT